MNPPKMEILKEVRALYLDCDGVLTDGALYYDQAGNRTLRFDAHDGLGLALLCRSNIQVAVISGRPTDIAETRYRELGVKCFYGKVHDKHRVALEICEALGVSPEHCAYVGDDLPDLGAFAAVGYRIAVANAAPELKEEADWVTTAEGGHGAVREVCEAILKAQNAWEPWVAKLKANAPSP